MHSPTMTYADSGNKGAFDFTTARTNAFSRSVACTFLLVIGWLWKWTSPTTPILARIDAHAETQVVTSTWQLRRSTGDFHGEDHGGPIDARVLRQPSMTWLTRTRRFVLLRKYGESSAAVPTMTTLIITTRIRGKRWCQLCIPSIFLLKTRKKQVCLRTRTRN